MNILSPMRGHGKRILEARKARGLTQERLGKLLGVSGSAIQQWESEKTSPHNDLWPRISQALGVQMSFLLYGEEKEESTGQPSEEISKVSHPKHEMELDPTKGSRMAFSVLSSNTGFAAALWENLVAFQKAVDMEEEMGRLEKMMQKVLEDNAALRAEVAELRAAIVGEKKKRDAAGNA